MFEELKPIFVSINPHLREEIANFPAIFPIAVKNEQAFRRSRAAGYPRHDRSQGIILAITIPNLENSLAGRDIQLRHVVLARRHGHISIHEVEWNVRFQPQVLCLHGNARQYHKQTQRDDCFDDSRVHISPYL